MAAPDTPHGLKAAAANAPDLPIHAVLSRLYAALAENKNAVLVAPPGAGKTTAVAPALLGAPWCNGQIIITSPRRVAARAAAERMAAQMGETPGETVGYQTRMDSRHSPRTRILVVTEAIFVSRLMRDPELNGVCAVLFDEAHERHLDCDLALALALESQAVLRADLRLVVMSATIDGARFAALLGPDAAVIESEGKAYPLTIVWRGGFAGSPVEEAMRSAILAAWRDETGDILAFLPGVREIARVQELLVSALPSAAILPLHGQVSAAEQRAALRHDTEGRRRIVLATAIAESSVTLDGVRVVVDSGLTRRAEYDQAAGTTHLVTHRASQAAAAQRAGRAARQGPGTAYRLWEEAAHPGRPAYDPPEILAADLAPLVLALADWGTQNPAELAWLDPPPASALEAARTALKDMGALDERANITPLGRQIAQLAMAPLHGAVALNGAQAGAAAAEAAARLVLLLQERGLGGRSEDLGARLARLAGERSARGKAGRQLAGRWAKRAMAMVAADSAGDKERQNSATSDPIGKADTPNTAHHTHHMDDTAQQAALALARARPGFVARKRGPSGEAWLASGGRGFMLDPASPLARSDWLVIGDAQGAARGARITAALALTQAEVETALSAHITSAKELRWNPARQRVEPRVERRLGAIRLASGPDPAPDEQDIVDILVEKAVERIGKLLPAGFIARARFAGISALAPVALGENAALWLAPLLAGRRDLGLPPSAFAEAALALLDWDQRQMLDRRAPREFVTPAGTRHKIVYDSDDAPSTEVRAQALFGLDKQPMIGPQGQATPLLLKLTSPAGRPIQATRDLPGFWRGSWAEVRKEMKGRYPKHRWPERPWEEKASLKTKNAYNQLSG